MFLFNHFYGILDKGIKSLRNLLLMITGSVTIILILLQLHPVTTEKLYFEAAVI